MSNFVGRVNVQDRRPLFENWGEGKVEKGRQYVRNAQMLAAAALVGSVALLLLGLTLTARGSFIAGVPLLILSVPSCYLAYNGYHVCKNLKEMFDRALDDIKMSRPEQTFDKEELKRNLAKGTVCFEGFIDLVVDKL